MDLETDEMVSEIEREFKDSETPLIENTKEDRGKEEDRGRTVVYGERKWYNILGVILCIIFGAYVFVYFLPIEFGNKSLWLSFKTNCCKKGGHGFLCSSGGGCSSQLATITKNSNVTLDFIYNTCCFYMANVETPWILLPFVSCVYCNYNCLHDNLRF